MTRDFSQYKVLCTKIMIDITLSLLYCTFLSVRLLSSYFWGQNLHGFFGSLSLIWAKNPTNFDPQSRSLKSVNLQYDTLVRWDAAASQHVILKIDGFLITQLTLANINVNNFFLKCQFVT